MVLKISRYNKTPASNNAAPPVGAPERNDPNTVNNIQREMMAAMAELWEHVFPRNTTTGTGSAYALNIGQSNLGPQDGYLYVAKFHAANAATPTIAINGQTAVNLKNHNGEDLPAGAIMANSVHMLAYNGTEMRNLTLNEYHEIRRGTRRAEIDSSGQLQYLTGTNVQFRVTTAGDGTFNGDVIANATAIASDERDKSDIKDLDTKAMSNLFSYISPKSFIRRNGKSEIGFSAQNLDGVDPRLTVKYFHDESKEERLAIKLAGLLAVLWCKVMELDRA